MSSVKHKLTIWMQSVLSPGLASMTLTLMLYENHRRLCPWEREEQAWLCLETRLGGTGGVSLLRRKYKNEQIDLDGSRFCHPSPERCNRLNILGRTSGDRRRLVDSYCSSQLSLRVLDSPFYFALCFISFFFLISSTSVEWS